MSLRLKAFLAFILAVTLVQAGLGVWQWRRLAEKEALIAGIAASAKGEPRPLAGAPLWGRVRLTGRYLHQHTAYVRTSRPDKAGQQGGFGVLVMTPIVTRLCEAEGRCGLVNIYVNRGFVPTPPDGRIPAYDRSDEAVTITGFIRPGEKPGLIGPSNDPTRKTWFTRDVEAMARTAELTAVPSGSAHDRFIDREASAGEKAPYGLEAATFLANIPNNHRQYAFTWWGLALTNLVVLGFFLAKRRRDEETR